MKLLWHHHQCDTHRSIFIIIIIFTINTTTRVCVCVLCFFRTLQQKSVNLTGCCARSVAAMAAHTLSSLIVCRRFYRRSSTTRAAPQCSSRVPSEFKNKDVCVSASYRPVSRTSWSTWWSGENTSSSGGWPIEVTGTHTHCDLTHSIHYNEFYVPPRRARLPFWIISPCPLWI